MNNQLTQDQKELRKVNKKIRNLKARKGSWEMEKIMVLEGQRDILEKKFRLEDQAKAGLRAAREEKMTDDDWMNRFRVDQDKIHRDIDSHIIPNTRETRLHRKRVIHNLQEHQAEEYMRQQILLRFSIINGIKENLMREENTITS